MTDVKRPYDGSNRRARAEQVRELLLDTARQMLLEDGYSATTIPALADACGVSAESVYKRFPGKKALVRAVVERALRGAGPVAAETRSDALAADDPHALVRGWGRLAAEVAPRVAPILLLVHAAALTDPDLTQLERDLDEDRRRRMSDNARRLPRPDTCRPTSPSSGPATSCGPTAPPSSTTSSSRGAAGPPTSTPPSSPPASPHT